MRYWIIFLIINFGFLSIVFACPNGDGNCNDTSIDIASFRTSQSPVDNNEWDKYERNPVFNSGDEDEWDSGAVTCFLVRHFPWAYMMWYTSGGSFGLAQSRDGITWVRHRENPIMVPDSGRSYLGPEVLHDGEIYHMWYIDRGPDTSGISHATSEDGVHWTPSDNNPVTTHSGCIAVIWDGEQYRMFKQTNGFTLETSDDGEDWEDHGLVFASGEQHDFDEIIAAPSVSYYEDQLHLFYSAADTVGNRRGEIAIGHATSDDWGETWNIPDDRNDLRTLRPSEEWEGYGIYSSGVDYDGENISVWFAGASNEGGFGYASRPVNSVRPETEIKNTLNLWSVSPNPTAGEVKLNYLGTIDVNVNVGIFDLNGRQIYKRSFLPNQPIRLDPSLIGLPVGQYLIRINARGKDIHKRMVLVR